MKLDRQTDQVYSFIKSAGEILVVSHYSPDGDAIGSLLAFGGILEQMGKNHVLAIDDECHEKYRFMPGFEKIRNLEVDPLTKIFPKLVVLDAGSLSRTGSAGACVGENTEILNIDHHLTGELFGNINIVDHEACATAEILYELCKKLELKISKQIAYGIYVGILTDTGRFRFSNTSSQALYICADLISKGVDPGKVVEQLFFNLSSKVLTSVAWGLSNISYYCDGLVSIIYLDSQHSGPDSESLIDFGLSVEGVILSAFITEKGNNEFKVSLRSRSDVNVGEIAKYFGGGGHRKASGYRINGTYEETCAKLIDKFTHAISQIDDTSNGKIQAVDHNDNMHKTIFISERKVIK